MASGRLIEETKNDDNSNLLGAWPSQGKVGMAGGRRRGMFTVRSTETGRLGRQRAHMCRHQLIWRWDSRGAPGPVVSEQKQEWCQGR